jgi:hypothetical protein
MTIKTQVVDDETRIITKVVDGKTRISCTCCAGAECCMYPAAELGDSYAQSDLPDAVTINWPGFASGSAARSGSTYVIGGTTLGLSLSGTSWVLTNGGDTRNVGACLIPDDGGYTLGDDLVEDQFLDTYEVSDFDGFGFTVERQSLCQWYGQYELPFPYEGSFNTCTLFYGGLLAGEGSFVLSRKWVILYNYLGAGGSLYTKISPQNTPVGTYEDPPSFSGSPTVSAP